MSKIAILTDLHFGLKNGNEFFLNKHREFFKDVFWPYIDLHKITEILFTGDLVDNRINISHKTLYEVRKFFIEPLISRGIRIVCSEGNHDVTYKNTNEVSAVDLILGDVTGVEIVKHPRVVNIGGHDIALVPWMNPENYEECLAFIESHPADIIAGHFDIVGCVLTPGVLSEHGLPQSAFSKYPIVWSGHYHTSGQYGNIKYLGTAYEMTFADVHDRKGFHIFDGKTLTHIPNPNKIFHIITYNDLETDYLNEDVSKYKDCIVRVKVQTRQNSLALDVFINRLNEVCYKVFVVEESILEPLDGKALEASAIVKDTTSLIRDYVDSLEGNIDKDSILKLLLETYSDAVSIMRVSNES